MTEMDSKKITSSKLQTISEDLKRLSVARMSAYSKSSMHKDVLQRLNEELEWTSHYLHMIKHLLDGDMSVADMDEWYRRAESR